MWLRLTRTGAPKFSWIGLDSCRSIKGCLRKCFVRGSWMSTCKKKKKKKVKTNGFRLSSVDFCRFLPVCIVSILERRLQQQLEQTDPTTSRGSSECPWHCIAQQSLPSVIGLGNFHSRKLRVTWMFQVLPHSVHKLSSTLSLCYTQVLWS